MILNQPQNEVKLELTLTDPTAIKIVETIPEEQRDSIIEKYIILGDMVVTHASISTSKESVEAFFSPLRQDINTIREQLKHIVPTVMTPAKRGEFTEEAVFKSFEEHFMDDSFEDVSGIGRHSDILATVASSSTPVLIEVKDYTGIVPTSQVDKFWRDMEVRDTKYGIFVSLRSRISKCSSCINLKHNLDRTAVFVVESELNHSGHLFAFYIVKKLIELETLKIQDQPTEDLSKTLTKVNDIITEIQTLSKSLDTINNTAESLKTRNIRDIDKITSVVKEYKRKLSAQIENAFEELGRVSEK
ncbi:MAG: hypothetical protein NWE89_12600 [Candidatus Bathyarchaeota archaeon]|nr:hypothetical protein [Candidatus Bathyarchaeota archaeon]